MTIEERIEHICGHLPDGCVIRVDMENGACTVKAILPNETEIIMGDGESSTEEQMRDAFEFALGYSEASDFTTR